jgi:WD40 repeat protein
LNPNHTNRIFCVKGLKNDANLFFSGGWDASVRLWDVRIGWACVRKFGGPMVSADSLDLRNNVLLAGNYATQDILQFWDFTTGNLIETINIK